MYELISDLSIWRSAHCLRIGGLTGFREGIGRGNISDSYSHIIRFYLVELFKSIGHYNSTYITDRLWYSTHCGMGLLGTRKQPTNPDMYVDYQRWNVNHLNPSLQRSTSGLFSGARPVCSTEHFRFVQWSTSGLFRGVLPLGLVMWGSVYRGPRIMTLPLLE